jgi:hypothetical protein
MGDDAILAELRRIGNLLALLSMDATAKLLEKLKEKRILSSDERTRMFLFMDGQRTTQEIAGSAGTGERAAQIFIQELEKKHFITITRKGRAAIPQIDYAKVIELLCSDK